MDGGVRPSTCHTHIGCCCTQEPVWSQGRNRGMFFSFSHNSRNQGTSATIERRES